MPPPVLFIAERIGAVVLRRRLPEKLRQGLRFVRPERDAAFRVLCWLAGHSQSQISNFRSAFASFAPPHEPRRLLPSHFLRLMRLFGAHPVFVPFVYFVGKFLTPSFRPGKPSAPRPPSAPADISFSRAPSSSPSRPARHRVSWRTPPVSYRFETRRISAPRQTSDG